MAETVTVEPRWRRLRFTTVGSVWRRLPFTTTGLVAILTVAVATGSLWSAVEVRSWFPQVAYGLPSLEAGRWWTLLSGPFFALTPLSYVPVVLSFALFVGFAEWRLGTRKAALIWVASQLVAVLLTALLLLLVRGTGWTWAAAVAQQLDVGPSAGALACLAVASATIRPPWWLRVRIGLLAYVGVSVLLLGALADLEHLAAVAVALPLAGRLIGPLRTPGTGRPSRREWRLLCTVGLLLVLVIEIVAWLVPADGPLGSTAGGPNTGIDILVDAVVILLIANLLRRGRRLAWWVAVILAGLNVLVGALVGLAALVHLLMPSADIVIELDDDAPQFIAGGVIWAAVLVGLLVARRAFRVPSRRRLRRRGLPSATDRDTAIALLIRHGGSTVSWMTTWPENRYFLTADGESYVAYRVHAGVAIALGDPVGPPASRGTTVREFADMTERQGLVPCLFSATPAAVEAAVALGWLQVQVAEDNIVDLGDLEFRGKKWQDVRSALNKAGKEGIEYRIVTLADQPWAVLAQVRAISEEWVGEKSLPEMGFTLGGVEEALDRHVRVGLAVDGDGSVHGVTSWMPVYGDAGGVHGWTLDVMRRRQDAFRPVVEFLIASSCVTFRDEGAQFVSLSGAPLARAQDGGRAPALERLLDSIGAAMEPSYGFRSLHAFKAKFAPRYEPMYLAYRDEADLPRIGIAITRAYLPDAAVRDLVKLAAHPGS